MAEKKQDQKQADQPDDEAVRATSEQYAGADPRAVASETQTGAVNPVELGSDVDKLPPVPSAGMFMEADVSTEETAPEPSAAEGQPRGGGEKKS